MQLPYFSVFYSFISTISFLLKYDCCGGYWRPIFIPTQTQESQESQYNQSANKLKHAPKPTNQLPSLENPKILQSDPKVAANNFQNML